MLSHMWKSGLSDDDPNAPWQIQNIMRSSYHPQMPIEPFYNIFEPLETSAIEVKPSPVNLLKTRDILDSVRNTTVGHWGAIETWRRMNKFAPGHGLLHKEVLELIMHCAICKKDCCEKVDKLVPIGRSLKPPHSRSAIAIVAVEITTSTLW